MSGDALVQARVSRSLYRTIEKMAKARELSISALVRECLMTALGVSSSRRERLAAMALQGVIARQSQFDNDPPSAIVAEAIACADELIKQLDQIPEDL